MAGRKSLCRPFAAQPGLAIGATFVFSLLIAWSVFAQARPPLKTASRIAFSKTSVSASGVLSTMDDAAMTQRFAKDIWPLLTRAQANCVACHTKDNPSQLHFQTDASSSFHMLLSDGRLDAGNPTSLLARISATDPGQRMPPSAMPGWSDDAKKVLQSFITDLGRKRQAVASGPKTDELFPVALLTPYHGSSIPAEGDDNSFLTYYQLRRKIIALFQDDWRRGDHDLFEENLAQFGGADFSHRFDESSRPTPAYLSAVSAMSADVASRAYLSKSGPFVGRPETMPMPGQSPDGAIRAQIARLYQRLLFRNPSPEEFNQATALLRTVSSAQKTLAGQSGTLIFALDASDENGQHTSRQIEMQTVLDACGLTATYVDEDMPSTDTQKLPETFMLRAGDKSQHLEVSNRETSGQVSFKSVTLRGPLPATTVTTITSDNPSVQADGAWRADGDNAKDGYNDENNNKGHSRLSVPLTVAKSGKYEISVTWQKQDARVGADSVPIAVYSHDPSRLVLPAPPPMPPKGEAHFMIDETVDTIPYADLQTAFQFGGQPKNGVEIGNKDTHNRVVADAVSYVSATQPEGAPAAIVKADDAIGHGDWPVFKPHDEIFNATVGPNFHSDENKHKGELHLLFVPGKSVAPLPYYRARVTYPGEVDNETRVPVTVYAVKSSPIVRLRAPYEAPIGAEVTVDAAASYNVQHTPLHYTWLQIGGPHVTLPDPHAPTLHFKVPALQATQAAWEGLCRALVLHPDFLFTRPRSLTLTRDPAARRHLQLVKIAQDLVARPPTVAEIAQLDKGVPLTTLVNQYLASSEFDEFYYRRVRLYLESHGTPTQDEPARLWRYILNHNLPYTQILTSDYTILPDGKRMQRPDYCGHSGVLTMPGFIEGKPGLPHFNYAAQVCQKFLGYVFEVTPEIVKARGTQTAASTVDPKSICYSCHQVLTPLAYQRTRWSDDGKYHLQDESGKAIDDSDRHAVATYPFKGDGLEAFAQAAQRKERFHRAIIQTHFVWLFGREMRFDTDERGLYKRLWDETHRDHFALKPLIRTLVTSPEYLGETKPTTSRHERLAAR